MKNETELIKNSLQRILTAKGNRFVWNCIDVVAIQNNLHRYSSELKPLKNKLKDILYYLIIDKNMSLEQIKQLIKDRKIQQTKINIK